MTRKTRSKKIEEWMLVIAIWMAVIFALSFVWPDCEQHNPAHVELATTLVHLGHKDGVYKIRIECRACAGVWTGEPDMTYCFGEIAEMLKKMTVCKDTPTNVRYESVGLYKVLARAHCTVAEKKAA